MNDAAQPRSPVRSAAWLLIVALGLLGCAYVLRGEQQLLSNPMVERNRGPVDLARRWREEQFFENRVNPYRVSISYLRLEAGAPSPVLATLGDDAWQADGADYPPWFYVLGLPLFVADWPTTRALFGVVNALALVSIVLWIWKELETADRQVRILGVAGVLAAGSVCSTLGAGNWAVIIVAAIAWSARLSSTNGWPIAAALLSFAMVKPTLAIPFAMLLLARGRWRTVVLAAVLVVAAWVSAAWRLDATPLALAQQMMKVAAVYAFGGYGPLNGLAGLGLQAGGVSLVAAVVSCVVWGAWLLHERAAPTRVAMGLAALVARIGFYHTAHDDFILIFLFIAVLSSISTTLAWRDLALVALMGTALWMPSGWSVSPAVSSFHVLSWFVVAFFVARAGGSRLAVGARG